MSLLRNRKFQISVIISFIFLILLFVFLIEEKIDKSEIPLVETSPEGFTFFDLGSNTVLTKNIIKTLNDKLGSHSIENRGTMDLTINYKGFLQKYFKELYELNKKLNYPAGERIEHNTIKLMYRYTAKKIVPFDYVELIFSKYTKNPLLFKIKFQNGANIIDTIRKKYGTSRIINWDDNKGRSLYWKNNRDIFIISIGSDRFGNPEYHINIYYVENLEELLSTEKKEILERIEAKKRAGKTAF